jgi:Flp pilus assembly protein TadG
VTNKIAAIFRRYGRHKTEQGQALVLFAAGLAGFLALVGLSIDIGQMVTAKTDAQKVADAAALAGAQDLTNAAAATAPRRIT